jgi:hypothetical protein
MLIDIDNVDPLFETHGLPFSAHKDIHFGKSRHSAIQILEHDAHTTGFTGTHWFKRRSMI